MTETIGKLRTRVIITHRRNQPSFGAELLGGPSGVEQQSDRCNRHQADVVRRVAVYVGIGLQNLQVNHSRHPLADQARSIHRTVQWPNRVRDLVKTISAEIDADEGSDRISNKRHVHCSPTVKGS